MLVGVHGTIQVADHFGEVSCADTVSSRRFAERSARSSSETQIRHLLTNLKPNLLIERGDLLGSTQRRAFLALRLQRHVTIDLGVSCEMAMVRGDASRGRRLGMSHRGRSALTQNAIYPGVDRMKLLARLCDTGDAMSARVTERSHSPDGRSRANQSPNDVQMKRDRVQENGSQDTCRASVSRTKRRHDDRV